MRRSVFTTVACGGADASFASALEASDGEDAASFGEASLGADELCSEAIAMVAASLALLEPRHDATLDAMSPIASPARSTMTMERLIRAFASRFELRRPLLRTPSLALYVRDLVGDNRPALGTRDVDIVHPRLLENGGNHMHLNTSSAEHVSRLCDSDCEASFGEDLGVGRNETTKRARRVEVWDVRCWVARKLQLDGVERVGGDEVEEIRRQRVSQCRRKTLPSLTRRWASGWSSGSGGDR